MAIDPARAKRIHDKKNVKVETDDVCSMCGEFCAMKISSEALKK